MAVLITLALVARARADEIARGVVIRKEDRAVYVNLGRAGGAADGAPIRFKRPIALVHPVTKKKVDDWIPLGQATIAAAGDRLTRVVLDDELAAEVNVGDVAEIYVTVAATPTAAPANADDTPPPQIDPHTQSVLAIWAQQSGKPLAARIAAWEGWLSGHADSPYAEIVRTDLETLRAERDELVPRRIGQAVALPDAALEHAAPTRATDGRAIPLVFVAGAHAPAPASAWLHYRAIGARTFRRVLLAQDGDFALRGLIPGEVVHAPGVEYFVEASAPSGATAAAFASPDQPAKVEVAAPPVADAFAATHRSRMTITSTYLDFGNLDKRTGDHTDRVAWTEADVLYRVGRTLWGVRAGYGVYRGSGGYKDRAWSDAMPAPTASFSYGYAEAELRAPTDTGPPIDLALRGVAGVGTSGFGMGIEAKARVGDPDATNLSFLIASIAEIGTFGDVRFEAVPRPRLYVGMAIGVTDQPNEGDLGVRVATDFGWRVTPWLMPTVRASWQGRSADHSGVGAGAGVVFDW
ncbi:MAG TPA: hypothetical protein VL463_18330 [Kofleriaceae bacterium]|nr:hypothetical protein [Kofleriaceae bacterium]